MRTAVLWGLLALLCQHTLVSSHILGRSSSTSELAQIKEYGRLNSKIWSLLERFEETLADAAQEEEDEADYDGTKQQPVNSQASRGWNLDQEVDQEPLISAKSQLPAEGHSRTQSQRSRLQDLLLTARKRASGCFGARMDRIGNASGLGCNNGRG
ncbi:natriuretic peptides A isoform X1 [Anarrhichthys ocellatus]|uniref:natriuretic peptides A isoform X1 n=1 Tax=Anarrhichthys ocellatus TaxID=433405 RepID=UPI0012EE853E|nr:natriuretic peptides A-like isoform X1 [Anarrhichthys ocellatus]